MAKPDFLRICLLIPHYEHAGAIGALLERLAPHRLPCIIVDDGSGAAARAVLRELEQRLPWVTVEWRERNGGQGAAKRTGYRHALAAGYTHSLELDADGQHNTDDIPSFLALMNANPTAAVLGKPVFGPEAPKARVWGRQLSRGLVWLACGSLAVRDPLCGFRGLPLAKAVAVVDAVHTGNRMSFDPEFSVRLFRAGLPIVTLPTRVSYPTDGVSHFDMVRDNLRLAVTYLRLLAELPLAAPSIVIARRSASRRANDERRAASGPTNHDERAHRSVFARTRSSWGSIPERGSLLALRLLVAIYRRFGRRICLLILHPIALYYTLLAPGGRRASRIYLETLWATPQGRLALGQPPGLRTVLRHIHEFATNIFDRTVAWSGHLGQIDFHHDGSEVLFDLAREGRGAILVGAHQGSFDMMRLLANTSDMTVNVLMFTRHATRINTFFEQLDPGSRVRVLEIEPGSLKTAFMVRDCIARGEFVGILADRIHPGARDRPVFVDFLGRRTAFSLSPFVLASVLGCPVVHTQCIRLDDRTYESSARVISEGLDPRMPRRHKAETLLKAFVAGIERTCYRAPYQWFNFFDYWGDREGGDE